jgi:hypothetical protein
MHIPACKADHRPDSIPTEPSRRCITRNRAQMRQTSLTFHAETLLYSHFNVSLQRVSLLSPPLTARIFPLQLHETWVPWTGLDWIVVVPLEGELDLTAAYGPVRTAVLATPTLTLELTINGRPIRQ